MPTIVAIQPSFCDTAPVRVLVKTAFPSTSFAPRQNNRFASGVWEIGAQRYAGASLQMTCSYDSKAASLCGAKAELKKGLLTMFM